jgi:uncharacterized protein (TIGR02246 family)
MDPKSTAETVVKRLEDAWNAADGAAFAEPFAADADFVNIRGDHHSGREAIAAGHQMIFNTIYAGSTLRYVLDRVREIDDGVVLAHIRATLNAPTGPMAGETNALASIVLVEEGDEPRIEAFHNTVVAGA